MTDKTSITNEVIWRPIIASPSPLTKEDTKYKTQSMKPYDYYNLQITLFTIQDISEMFISPDTPSKQPEL